MAGARHQQPLDDGAGRGARRRQLSCLSLREALLLEAPGAILQGAQIPYESCGPQPQVSLSPAEEQHQHQQHTPSRYRSIGRPSKGLGFRV